MKQKNEKITADNKSVVSVEVIITYSNGDKGAVSILEFFNNKEHLMSDTKDDDDYLNDNPNFQDRESTDGKLFGKLYTRGKGAYNLSYPNVPSVKGPKYSFFDISANGLVYIKGTNKGLMVGCVDEIRWPRAEKQYAMYLLKNDNDLTEDDKVVLNSIITGNI